MVLETNYKQGLVSMAYDSPWVINAIRLQPGSSHQSLRHRERLRYKSLHGHARSIIEHTMGLLKGSWRCLDGVVVSCCKPHRKHCGVYSIVLACGMLQCGSPSWWASARCGGPQPGSGPWASTYN
ncbi:hypothetical protein CRENBAI_026659 [Crenichthys baileyi]|uniref:DDE Tnp4 domain-containing protein n=1 Tax=Crenichthys baileyi TaxID=28760 RepID=A0AAV9QSZ1_9TELE